MKRPLLFVHLYCNCFQKFLLKSVKSKSLTNFYEPNFFWKDVIVKFLKWTTQSIVPKIIYPILAILHLN